MGAAVCFAIIKCWENGENHGYNPAHIPAD
jgi:hypothetical protein